MRRDAAFVIRATCLALLWALAAPVAPGQQGMTVLRDDRVGLEVTVPSGWSLQKVRLADPLEEFRRGEFSFAISSPSAPDAPDWNALVFNAVQASGGGAPRPFVRISVHPAAGEAPGELADLFERSLERLGVPLQRRERAFRVGDATGADYAYTLMSTVRYVILTAQGKRVVLMAYVPSTRPADFEAVAPDIETIVQSIRLR